MEALSSRKMATASSAVLRACHSETERAVENNKKSGSMGGEERVRSGFTGLSVPPGTPVAGFALAWVHYMCLHVSKPVRLSAFLSVSIAAFS